MQAEIRPQVMRIRANHFRALHRSTRSAPGIFQREITEEEDADAQAEDFVGELQIASHAQFREADTGPVEIRHQIQDDHQRHNAPGDFAPQHGGTGSIECHRGAPRKYHNYAGVKSLFASRNP